MFRKGLRHITPERHGSTTPNIIPPRPHTRYFIVNEHESRKKLLRSTSRLPRHFRMEESGDIVELYPRNVRRYVVQTPRRSHSPHVSEDEEEFQRDLIRKSNRPRSLSDLRHPPRFYLGDRNDNPTISGRDLARMQYKSWEGGFQIDSDKSHHPKKVNLKNFDLDEQFMERHRKVKSKHKLEPCLTESDSMSNASSSDQQNSSTDQYIQVIHTKDKYIRSDGKLTKKKTKSGVDLNAPPLNELICSNV